MEEDTNTFYLRNIHAQLIQANKTLNFIYAMAIITALGGFLAGRSAVITHGWALLGL